MANNELLTYVREQLANGFTRDQIIPVLKQAGWVDLEISDAFAALTPKPQPPVPQPVPTFVPKVSASPVAAVSNSPQTAQPRVTTLGSAQFSQNTFVASEPASPRPSVSTPVYQPTTTTGAAKPREVLTPASAAATPPSFEIPPRIPVANPSPSFSSSSPAVAAKPQPLTQPPVSSQEFIAAGQMTAFRAAQKPESVVPVSVMPAATPAANPVPSQPNPFIAAPAVPVSTITPSAPLTASLQSQPQATAISGTTTSFAVPPRSVEEKSSKGLLLILLIFVLVAGGAVGAWFYLQKMPSQTAIVDETPAIPAAPVFSDGDMLIRQVFIPDDMNAALAFASSTAMTKPDSDFLKKYFESYTATNTPALAEAKKVLDRNKALLAAFDAAAKKESYQCSSIFGQNCEFTPVRNAALLAALKAYVQMKSADMTGALRYASDTVSLGKKITERADDAVSFLVGLSLQKNGYKMLSAVNTTAKRQSPISEEEKIGFINQLRDEHKRIVRFSYTSAAQAVDYVVSRDDKPDFPVPSDLEELFEEYRVAIGTQSWDPVETKKFFYDSAKISLTNIDKPCGEPLSESHLELGFDPNIADVENYVGKMMYTSGHGSFENLNIKRCEVEKLITS